MHITEWEASRSGAGITVAMTDAGGIRHKQFVKKIEGKHGGIVAVGGDGARIHLVAASGETSAEVAAIAGELLNLEPAHLVDNPCIDVIVEKVRTLAASCLGQRQ